MAGLMKIIKKLLQGGAPKNANAAGTVFKKERTSESLVFGAFPKPHKTQKWFEQCRAATIACCRDPDAGWEWWNEIRDKTFDELKEVGGEQFERADLLVTLALTKIDAGGLGSILLAQTEDCARPNLSIIKWMSVVLLSIAFRTSWRLKRPERRPSRICTCICCSFQKWKAQSEILVGSTTAGFANIAVRGRS